MRPILPASVKLRGNGPMIMSAAPAARTLSRSPVWLARVPLSGKLLTASLEEKKIITRSGWSARAASTLWAESEAGRPAGRDAATGMPCQVV